MRFILRFILLPLASLLPLLPLSGLATNSLPSLAQSPIIRSWGTEAGLPQNTVNAILQSRDGYMWLATRDGLARFDGLRFKTYGLPDGLPSVDISCLCEDRAGTLWIGTSGAGLCCLKAGKIEIMSDPGRHPGSDTISALEVDAAGRLWVGTGGGLRICQNGKLMEEPAFAEIPHKPVRCLLRSRDGQTMWVGSASHSLTRFRNGHMETMEIPAPYPRIIAQALYEDRQGRLWVSIGNGTVLCRDNERWRVYDEKNGLPFAFVSSFTEDADGMIWAGSLDDGLYRFDGERFNVVRRKDGLSAEDIRSLYCDHQGNLWVGTRTGGLNRLSRRKLLVLSSAQGLTNDFTRSVAETTDGQLWLGTIGGSLYRGDLSGFHPFRPGTNGSLIYFYASVDSVLAMRDGSVWWGASGAVFHWQDNRLADCYTNEPWLQSVSVTALQHDGHDGIWIGTSAGHLEHLQNGRFTEFHQQLARAAITSLAVEKDGSLWVGSVAGGVKRVRAGSDQVFSLEKGLASDSVRTLYLDRDDNLWIGTAGGGLSCWHNGHVTTFTASHGLTMRTVSQIVEDGHDYLWLGCNSGISKVSRQDLLDCADGKRFFIHSSSFGINDGMLAEECSGGFCPAGLKTQSGLICISTVKGLVFLNPDEQRDETPPPRVLLEEILVNGKLQPPQSNPPKLIIPPGNSDIELHYTVVEFSAPEKIGFRYQLAGHDTADGSWTEALGRRQINYQHIPPGEYQLHIQACNPAGMWGHTDTTLAVSVQPFYWETAWFRVTLTLVSAGLFAGALWFILRRRYKHRLARLQTLNAVERERLRISKDMHDHVGGMLTQVSQLSDLGLNEAEGQPLVKDRFEHIGNRARIAVQALDEIVWATNHKNDNLASFAEYVSRFSDEFFEHTHIRCWQEVPTTFPVLPLRADVRHNVFLAVREACNNALKHSHGTAVWLRMKLDHDLVTLEIEDNGCGFDPGALPSGGNGLGNMQARLSEDGGRTVVISAPGKGTRIRFIFPVNT